MITIADFGIWAAGAVIVVGVVQWAKGLFPKVPSKLWSIVLPVVSAGAGFAYSFKTGVIADGVWTSLGIWAIAQLGYELIVQTVQQKLKG